MTDLDALKARTPYPGPSANKCADCVSVRPIPAGHRCERFSWLVRGPETVGCRIWAGPLSFKTDPSCGGMQARFDKDGRVHRNAVKIGKGGQTRAREMLRQWARESGWNG